MIFLVILHCQWQFLSIFPPVSKSHPLTVFFFGDQDTMSIPNSVDGDDDDSNAFYVF